MKQKESINHDGDVSIDVDLSDINAYYEAFKVKSELLLEQGRFHDFHVLFVKFLNWS
jgi:hypothetical protein